MEEAGRRKCPMTIQRAFAGSRLEGQILSRIYELTVPVFRRSTDAVATPAAGATVAEETTTSQQIATGG
jgi:hypothetical protein